MTVCTALGTGHSATAASAVKGLAAAMWTMIGDTRQAKRIERSTLGIPGLLGEVERAKAAMGPERQRKFDEALRRYAREQVAEMDARRAREREERAAESWSGRP
jgi:hypothetical protein